MNTGPAGRTGHFREVRRGITKPTVFLNGEFLPYEKAVVPVEDRGFVFADGIYEVIRVYGGRMFRADDHMTRLQRSAASIALPLPMSTGELLKVAEELVRRDNLDEASIYLQVTRGPAPRSHTFPAEVHPTVVGWARPATPPAASYIENGASAITLPDERWLRCDVKSVGLLLNTIGKQKAVEAGAYDALFIRDGYLTEATSSNAMAVFGGKIYTHPLNNLVLPGITRKTVLELCEKLGIPVVEEAVPAAELARAEEIFITGTVTEVLAITMLDGRPVGTGKPGPVFRKLHEAFVRFSRGQ